jgi:hypothetical protein
LHTKQIDVSACQTTTPRDAVIAASRIDAFSLRELVMIWPGNLKTGWWSFALPGLRDHPYPTTYSLFAYEDLPPIDAPTDETFQWLRLEPKHEQWSLAINGYPNAPNPDLSQLPDLIAQAHVRLPPAFVNFMQIASLHEHIRSCTACFLELNDYVVRVTKPLDGVLLHFLSDQQYCLQWYLYASQSGDHCVVVSGETYGLQFKPDEERRDDVDLSKEEMWMCAPSFTDFIYRFWLENEIWFNLSDGKPLSPIQKDYLEHYRRLK